jgi:hypothetical protein
LVRVLAGEAAEVLDVDLATFADDAIDVSVRFGFRCGHQRVNVEDLAATQGHALAGFAQDEAVAGHER